MPTITIRGARLRYDDDGTQAPAIVFAHGFLFDRHQFDDAIDALSRTHRCVAFDWRGQGESETTPSGYDAASLTDDVATLIERLAIAPCHYVGSSMGGFMGLMLALRRPELLRSLVLVNGFAQGEPASSRPMQHVLAGLLRVLGPSRLAASALGALTAPDFARERPASLEAWRATIAKGDRDGLRRTLRGFVMNVPDVSGELSRVRVPTLVIGGEDDRSYAPATTRRLASAIRDAECHVLPRCGHAAAVERPDEVTRLLSRFLARVDALPSG
jgi:pimeloyl-ACP methyl ester carboxylesterase